MGSRERYRSGARLYDLLSAEWPVYRIGRTEAIRLLDPRPGERVLDLGCGTGLNHPLLHAAIAPEGRILGVDLSASMLEVARRRAERRGLDTVRLLSTDAVALDPRRVVAELGGLADVVLATYTLSIMADPAEAWRRAMTAARPGARVAIVDMQAPSGAARAIAPLARAFAGFGGADLEARPWTALERTAEHVRGRSLRGGHIQVRTGVLPMHDRSARPLPDGVSLRPLTVADADELVALNDAAAPAVPITPAPQLARLIGLAELALGLERDGRLVGFVIAMSPGAAYESENYAYFEARGVDHLYVDRIVIAETERGRGLGVLLYDAVFAEARSHGRREVTCEVNLDPPNPGSLAFHERLGFRPVGTQATKGGAVTVSLLAAAVDTVPGEPVGVRS
jgi:predicted GNAT superfamily acetyltransferase/ubiquinone/menaquinone biosynthesis C-methylase UbiE